jgi:Rps23 Pro-64 3,4-dihydroxylase Tpa1-like proline 4-hydroxylase
MDIQYLEKFNVFIIKNVFDKEINKKILEEIVKNEFNFNESIIGPENSRKHDPNIRSNTVAYYDNIYSENREDSFLLKNIDVLFRNISSLLSTSPYPLHKFSHTNIHETQVSRYGNEQHYKWHTDSSVSDQRLITFVYYPLFEPIKWKGGDIEISKSPIWNDEPINKDDVIKIKPENNLGLIFPSNIAHRVNTTSSSDIFEEGRFSVNCWIGIR